MHNIVCIGGINVDVLGLAKESLKAQDSNIGRVTVARGGVACNIAQRLANLGAKSYILSALGKDMFTDFLLSECKKQGIDTSLCIKTDLSSPVYIALHDNAGEMQLALNDTLALESLSSEIILEKLSFLKNISLAVIDCNLNKEAIDGLAKKADFPLIADPVSTVKADRIKDALPHLYAIKPNLIEAQSLTGQTGEKDCAKYLLDKGVKQVYISLGSRGLYFSDGRDSGTVPSEKIKLSHVTGAGDSMVAGLALGIANKLSIADTAAFGSKCALEKLMNTAKEIENV